MTSRTIPVTGGCLCGAVRFESAEAPSNVGVCHCRICQKHSGGAYMTWAFLKRDKFRFTVGEPVYYRSSATGQRGFCGKCGSPLVFKDATDNVGVPVGTFDHPGDWPPDFAHGGMESRIAWDVIADGLPCFTTDQDPVVQQSHAAGRHELQRLQPDLKLEGCLTP
jgi:hypothetical protein